MITRERLLLETLKNVTHAADMLCYDARNMKRAVTENESRSLVFSVEQRLTALRKTMDVLTDQLAALKILEKT